MSVRPPSPTVIAWTARLLNHCVMESRRVDLSTSFHPHSHTELIRPPPCQLQPQPTHWSALGWTRTTYLPINSRTRWPIAPRRLRRHATEHVCLTHIASKQNSMNSAPSDRSLQTQRSHNRFTAVQWPVGGKRTSLHASQPTSSRLTVHPTAVHHSLSIVPHTDRLDLLLSLRLTLTSTIIHFPPNHWLTQITVWQRTTIQDTNRCQLTEPSAAVSHTCPPRTW